MSHFILFFIRYCGSNAFHSKISSIRASGCKQEHLVMEICLVTASRGLTGKGQNISPGGCQKYRLDKHSSQLTEEYTSDGSIPLFGEHTSMF